MGEIKVRILLNFEERKKIEKLIADGISGSQIAKILGRSKNSVNSDIRLNGGRDIYNAEKAEESYKCRMKKKNKKIQNFSEDYKNKFLSLIEAGESIHSIRRSLKCGYLTIMSLYKQCGLKAPTLYFILQELSDKIYNIEQQNEILFEMVKND